jgi:fructose-1,6-bisphosphatase/sedoheptulose 1,7-bisphosphatase-like protein
LLDLSTVSISITDFILFFAGTFVCSGWMCDGPSKQSNLVQCATVVLFVKNSETSNIVRQVHNDQVNKEEQEESYIG